MSVMPDDKVTVKSRPSPISFRENYAKYKSSGSYVPRKEKAHRRLLAEQKSMSYMSFEELEISQGLESKNYWAKPKILVKSQIELSRVETAP